MAMVVLSGTRAHNGRAMVKPLLGEAKAIRKAMILLIFNC
jgi:hypothetical protein